MNGVVAVGPRSVTTRPWSSATNKTRPASAVDRGTSPMDRAVEEQRELSTSSYHSLVRSHHAHERIVVGVDGSEGSKCALRWAARQAELTGASLDVVLAWEVPVVPYGVWTGYDAGGRAVETLDATVQEILVRSDQSHVVATATEGRPQFTLLEAAKQADLLVVGSRGHGSFASLLLGSVSEHCATHASCPVVIVPRCR